MEQKNKFSLDYSLQSPEERKQLVEQILSSLPEEELTPSYLEILANYLVFCMEKQERRERHIITENRKTTMDKRETSFEGLASSFESGEDGIYNLIQEDKNIIFRPKVSITAQDLAEIPFLAQARQAIEEWEAASKGITGRDAYIMKKAAIEMRKDQYLIKQAYMKPSNPQKLIRSSRPVIRFTDDSYIAAGQVVVSNLSLMNPKTISAILCNYSRLKEDSWGQFDGDTWALMWDFDIISSKALAEYPVYQDIAIWKIDGMPNQDVQQNLLIKYDKTYSTEYISKLWRNKIPKIIAEAAREDYLEFTYRRNHYPMKFCNKCGQLKPANNQFFSKNSSSKDGFYSVCKKCRHKGG